MHVGASGAKTDELQQGDREPLLQIRSGCWSTRMMVDGGLRRRSPRVLPL